MTINYAIADTEADVLSRAASIDAEHQALLHDGRTYGDFWGADGAAAVQEFFNQLGANIQAI
jgi:hypothetical protein